MARADCPLCNGSGWKTVERPNEIAETSERTVSNPEAVSKPVWAVPCDCTFGDRADRALAKVRVPERYRHCDFANYETDNEILGRTHEEIKAWTRSLAAAKVVVERFAQEYSPVREIQTEQGLLLMGPCGVGKTHLAVAALKQIVQKGNNGLFYDYRELLKEIQDSYNPESQSTEMGVLEPVLKTEVLVLDDVGSSKSSQWALETVGHILNSRYNDKRTTILTTNFLDPESAVAQSLAAQAQRDGRVLPREDSLTDRVGKRIRSRLYEMCRTVEIWAADYRKEIRDLTRGRAFNA